jgi:nickel/cobalt exporter
MEYLRDADAPFADLLSQGSAPRVAVHPLRPVAGGFAWLEPGHSKTMMAAFIVAVRGPLWQAILLGLSATPYGHRRSP